MGETTGIEWTSSTWNPVAGCSVISPGCTNCYAMKVAGRFNGTSTIYEGLTKRAANGEFVWSGNLKINMKVIDRPLRWTRPREIFVNSMSDLFHEKMPVQWILEVLSIIALSPQHTYQVLTKRSSLMRALMSEITADDLLAAARGLIDRLSETGEAQHLRNAYEKHSKGVEMPLSNLWLGVSVEDQRRANERIPDLLGTPAAIRFISAEPLLGPIDTHAIQISENVFLDAMTGAHWMIHQFDGDLSDFPKFTQDSFAPLPPSVEGLDWVIVGGESGHGSRPMHPDWVRSLRDQARRLYTSFFFKQWGNWVPTDQYTPVPTERQNDIIFSFADGTVCVQPGKRRAGNKLDGQVYQEMPKESQAA